MAFSGFDPEDGAALYDTKEAAIERAKQMIAWNPDPKGDEIWIHKKSVPLWFAHLVRDTWFRRLAYTKLIENKA
jgi:hypothetical protein